MCIFLISANIGNVCLYGILTKPRKIYRDPFHLSMLEEDSDNLNAV